MTSLRNIMLLLLIGCAVISIDYSITYMKKHDNSRRQFRDSILGSNSATWGPPLNELDPKGWWARKNETEYISDNHQTVKYGNLVIRIILFIVVVCFIVYLLK